MTHLLWPQKLLRLSGLLLDFDLHPASRKLDHPPKSEANTHYSAARGCFMDCSFPVEMMLRDSIDDIYIEPFPVIVEQVGIWQ